MAIILRIVERHAEDAAFLWTLRDRHASGKTFRLWDLARLDRRLDAHLDGLRIAGEDGWTLCSEALVHRANGEVFAAAVTAFESGRPHRIDTIFDLVADRPDLARGLISALGWTTAEVARRQIGQLLASGSTLFRRAGVAAAAIRRLDPGPVLESSLEDVEDSFLTARALEAVGELGLREMLPLVLVHLASSDEHIRFSAAWSASLLGDKSALPVLGAFALEPGSRAGSACALGLRCLRPRDACQTHQALADCPELSRLAVAAVGTIGDPALVEWLLPCLRVPALARLAGESFALITGIDLGHPAFSADRPDGFVAGPTDDPADEDVTPDPDADLPWPDPAKIEEWWYRFGPEFRVGTRYLLGRPITPENACAILLAGRQHERAAAAIELALETGGSLVEIRAPGFFQQQHTARLLSRRLAVALPT